MPSVYLLSQFDIQFFASKKGVGSTRNGRDSHSKRLGMKCSEGSLVTIGSIIYRQRGTKIHQGKNVGMGRDNTLFALANGYVKYGKISQNRTCVHIIPIAPTIPHS